MIGYIFLFCNVENQNNAAVEIKSFLFEVHLYFQTNNEIATKMAKHTYWIVSECAVFVSYMTIAIWEINLLAALICLLCTEEVEEVAEEVEKLAQEEEKEEVEGTTAYANVCMHACFKWA